MLEIEVKYHIKDRNAMHARILALGAESTGQVFETNILFDDSKGTLLKKRELLRLRYDGRARLTFKSRRADNESEYKIHDEIEVEVSDFDTARQLIEAIGFSPQQVYEKRREEFILDKAHICLDTMPYGEFLEIEADKKSIRFLSERLGLRWEDRITANYLEIFDTIKKSALLPFDDVTFDNFRGVSFDLEACLNRLKNG